MEPSAIKVEVDSRFLKDLINTRINEELQVQIHWVDISRLEQMTSMSYRFLHDNFLKRPSVKQYERTKARKKYYKYPEVINEMNKIIEVEW